MKRFLKWFCIFLIIILAALYVEFLFFLPKQIDLNSYKPLIKKLVKEYTDFDVEFLDANLITTLGLKSASDFLMSMLIFLTAQNSLILPVYGQNSLFRECFY